MTNQANGHSFSDVYSANVLELVSIGADFCSLLEQSKLLKAKSVIKQMQTLLAELYMKGLSFDFSPMDNEMEYEHQVTEEDYNLIRNNVAACLGSYDDYLDVFLEDMKYSDKPILKTVSEDVADIYQDVRNFISAYEGGSEEVMFASLSEVLNNFRQYWGGRCLSVMRVLHEILYGQEESFSDEE